MLFTPNYTVSYKGEFYGPGVAFPIDPADREEMEKHGTVEVAEATEPPAQKPEPAEPVSAAPSEKPAKRGGRPRKAVSK